MTDLKQTRTVAGVLGLLYTLVACGAFFGGSVEDRIVGLLFLLVLLFGLFAAAVVRFRPVAMTYLFWVLAAAQTLVLLALLSAQVGSPGIVAFINLGLIAGMVLTATLFGRHAGGSGPG